MASWEDMDMATDEASYVSEEDITDNEYEQDIHTLAVDALLAHNSIREMQEAYSTSTSRDPEERCLSSSHCILSRYHYENSTGTTITTGNLGNSRYIIPLHILSVVPGHAQERIGVNASDSTKLGIGVLTRCFLASGNPSRTYIGSDVLCEALHRIDAGMCQCDFNPPGFTTTVSVKTTGESSNCPIAVGYSKSVEDLKSINLYTIRDNKVYRVTTDCPNTRYRAPSGLAATMVANSVVLMQPCINQYLVDASVRAPKSHERGFLCMCSTSTSAALKGLLRYACSGTIVRSYNMGVGQSIRELRNILLGSNCACKNEVDLVSYSIAGLLIRVCRRCHSVIVRFIQQRLVVSPHSLTLSRSTKSGSDEYTISFCTGALMRKVHSGVWVDSNSTIEDYGSFDTVTSPCLTILPYYQYINPIRASLLNVYMSQAICKPCCRYHPSMVLIPQYGETMIALPSLEPLDKVLLTDHVPGLNLRCIFMNMEYTYEDGIVMSRSAASRFRYIANVSVYLDPHRDEIPNKHSTINPYSTNWWQNHFKGTVSSIEATSTNLVRVVVYCECLPVNGDKFTTLHGQKGVVTILDDLQMPNIDDFTAEIVIGSSSVIKRQTLSQMLEAAYNKHCVDNMNTDSVCEYLDIEQDYMMHYGHTDADPVQILSRYEGSVQIDERNILRVTRDKQNRYPKTSPVRANYGIIRVMQSSFLASFRMSATSSLARAAQLTPEHMSSRGGSRSLGEMEVTQLLASGMVNTLNEFNASSDLIVVEVCRQCGCITFICECDGSNKSVNKVKIPNRLLKCVVMNYLLYKIKTVLR
mmetsp:Transcript_2713/g.7224  ORF Transcript_2713/g.7224 Transcript_2713/m.7224 type:complete len:810 (+) Transcript_2713:24952-27381(+)